MEQVTDENIKKEWAELHKKLVNEVISFCKKYHIDASEFNLSADCLEPSIKQGEWMPFTDSSFGLLKVDEKDDYRLKDVLCSM